MSRRAVTTLGSLTQPPSIDRSASGVRHRSQVSARSAMEESAADPGLLDEVSRWQTDDLWIHTFDAFAVALADGSSP